MNFILILFIIALVTWFAGMAATAYHVIKYASPGDKLLVSFFVFFITAAVGFFWAISFVLEAL